MNFMSIEDLQDKTIYQYQLIKRTRISRFYFIFILCSLLAIVTTSIQWDIPWIQLLGAFIGSILIFYLTVRFILLLIDIPSLHSLRSPVWAFSLPKQLISLHQYAKLEWASFLLGNSLMLWGILLIQQQLFLLTYLLYLSFSLPRFLLFLYYSISSLRARKKYPKTHWIRLHSEHISLYITDV